VEHGPGERRGADKASEGNQANDNQLENSADAGVAHGNADTE